MNNVHSELHYGLPAHPMSAFDDGWEIRDLLGILNRRKWLILGVVGLVTTFAIVIGSNLTPKYSARTLVLIDPRDANIVDLGAVLDEIDTSQAQMETQVRMLTSRYLVEAVMAELNLFEDPEFIPDNRGWRQKAGDVVKATSAKWDISIPPAWLARLGLIDVVSPPVQAEEQQVHPLRKYQTIEKFRNHYHVNPDGQSYVIAISFESTDSEKAARIANKAAELYISGQRERKLNATVQASGFLGQRVEEIRADAERAERAVAEYRRDHGLDQAAGSSLVEREILDLQREIAIARTSLAERLGRLDLIEGMRRRGESLTSLSEVQGSPIIINLRQEVAGLIQDESELRLLYGERHPRVRELENEKRELRANIAAEAQRIVQNLENEAVVMQSRVDALIDQIEALSQEVNVEREAGVGLAQLEQEAQVTRELYQAFLQRFKQTSEQRGLIEADARIISSATPPLQPTTPSPAVFGVVGLGASTILGILVALLLERLDHTVRSGRQIEASLGIPALSHVPRLNSLKGHGSPHHYLLKRPLSAYSESIRAVFTALQISDPDNPARVIMVTSSLPNEGKTTFASSLATFIANSGKRCVLVDLDLRQPSVHGQFHIKPTTGLVEYLTDNVSLEEATHSNIVEGLDLLLVSRLTSDPDGLLAGRTMHRLVATLRDKYDFVVFDTAPVLGLADTTIIAGLADKALFAVRWGKTSLGTAANGLSRLRMASNVPTSAVVTMVDVKAQAKYGYEDSSEHYKAYQKYYLN